MKSYVQRTYSPEISLKTPVQGGRILKLQLNEVPEAEHDLRVFPISTSCTRRLCSPNAIRMLSWEGGIEERVLLVHIKYIYIRTLTVSDAHSRTHNVQI